MNNQKEIYTLRQNGAYLGVNYATLMATQPQIVPGPCEYAAFNEQGEIIALGVEEGGPHSNGSWRWIKGEFDNRIEKDLSSPPVTPFQ